MANIFETLKARFVNSMTSVIEKTPRTVVNLGTSDGSASQQFNFPDKQTTIDSDTIYVSQVIWSKVTSFGGSGPLDTHYRIVYASSEGDVTTSRPYVLFGDGVNGKKPVSGSQITADYESCRFKLSNREILALFESSIIPVEMGFGVEINVTDIDYDSDIFDISYTSGEPVEDMILYHAKMLTEIKMLDADKGMYYKSQSVIIDGKQVSKSQLDNLKEITSWYNNIVKTYRKSKQVPRFILRSEIFEDTSV